MVFQMSQPLLNIEGQGDAVAIVYLNPVEPSEKVVHLIPAGQVFFDWLTSHYPKGFGRPIQLIVNNEPVELENMDFVVEEGDAIAILVSPAGPAVAGILIIAAITAVAALAASLVVFLIFGKPKKPKDASNPDPVYSLNGGQNMPRLGEPIPAIYGKVITYPDSISPPYSFFAGNDMYIDQILCLGQGEFEIHDMLISDTPASALSPDVMFWVPFASWQHTQRMGVIETATGVRENVLTSLEVSDQELSGEGTATAAGPFITSNPGFPGTLVEVDFVWPNGLYTMHEDGTFHGKEVNFTVTAEQIDDNNNPTGTVISVPIAHSDDTNTPRRVTWSFGVPLGRYRVKVERITPVDPSNRIQSTFNWTGLKFQLANTPGPVYGDTTLIAVRIKATNGISSDAANKLRASVTRKLLKHGSGPFEATRSPVDAYIDAAINPTYGLGRPLTSIDVATLVALEAHWTPTYAKFDAIFNQKTTFWDALTIILQPVATVPVRTGKLLSAVCDGKKIAPMQLFADTNMIDGTFQARYEFSRPGEFQGIQVEYRDPTNFAQAFAQYPPGAIDLENVNLFGCTDKTIAEQYARLLWQRHLRLRQFASFETEMEGRIPLVGSRVLVSTTAVAWGESGEVVSTYGSNGLVLDRTVDFTKYVSPVIVLRDVNGKPSAKIPVRKGANLRQVTLTGGLPFAIQPVLGDLRPTAWAIGDSRRRLKDFTVQSIEASGKYTAKVSLVLYDERTWDNTLAFLQVPIA